MIHQWYVTNNEFRSVADSLLPFFPSIECEAMISVVQIPIHPNLIHITQQQVVKQQSFFIYVKFLILIFYIQIHSISHHIIFHQEIHIKNDPFVSFSFQQDNIFLYSLCFSAHGATANHRSSGPIPNVVVPREYY